MINTTNHITTSQPALQADEVRRALSVLTTPGQVVEVRALHATTRSYNRPHTVIGYFDNHNALVSSLKMITGVECDINDSSLFEHRRRQFLWYRIMCHLVHLLFRRQTLVCPRRPGGLLLRRVVAISLRGTCQNTDGDHQHHADQYTDHLLARAQADRLSRARRDRAHARHAVYGGAQCRVLLWWEWLLCHDVFPFCC